MASHGDARDSQTGRGDRGCRQLEGATWTGIRRSTHRERATIWTAGTSVDPAVMVRSHHLPSIRLSDLAGSQAGGYAIIERPSAKHANRVRYWRSEQKIP
jgi:hypothetical protein